MTATRFPAAPSARHSIPTVFVQADTASLARIRELEQQVSILQTKLGAQAKATRANNLRLAIFREVDRIDQWQHRAALHGLTKAAQVRPIVTIWSNAIHTSDITK